MTAHFKHHTFTSSFKPTHLGRVERPDHQASRSHGIGSQLIVFLESAVRRNVGRIARWYQRRSAIFALQALNDHYLKDIGLDRSGIVASVGEAARDGRTV